MKTLDDEYKVTTHKMAEAVMEYAAQFVARSYLESYRKAEEDENGAFVPRTFDERVYNKVERGWLVREAGRALLKFLKAAGVAAALFCVGFTIFVFLMKPLRDAVLAFFGV